MESKPDKHLIIVGVLAFIGVILLVATVVLTCTALFTWIEASGGSPRLNVWEIRGELPPENASIIHLTEKDFEQHPALDSAIPGAGIRGTHRTVSSTSERSGVLR